MDCQTITCPVCQKEHTGLPKDIGLVVYLAGECPICLEETSPVVALPCGHAVCEDDFVRLFIAAQQQKLEQEERDQLMDQIRCGGGGRRRITNVCDLQEMIFLNSSRSRRNRLFRDDMTHVSFTNNHPTQNFNKGKNNNSNNKENDDGSNDSIHPFMPEPRVVVRKIPISSVVVEETNAERSVQMENNNEKFLNTKVLKKRSNNVGSQLCITCSDDNGSMRSSKSSKSSKSSGSNNSFKSLRSRLSRKSISRKNQKNRGSFSSSGNSSCRSSKSIASASTSSSSRSISSSSDIHNNDTIVICCSSSSMEEKNTSTNEPMETLQKFLEHMNQQMKSNLITKNPYTNAYLSTRLPAGGVDPR